MISLSIADFFSLILLLAVGWIAFLAFRLQSRGHRRDWHLTSRHLFQCDRCHLSFVPEKAVTLCRCPRCNAHCIKRSK
ncbi:MAG: hypothetical protein J6S54_00495 [Lentisphaeria bacterium]|nr:hypothetical protein [Lentisphaeria bacterium]